MITYYSLDDQALVARIEAGETYRILNSKGKWFDGRGLVEGYFWKGEIGIEEIDERSAIKLAEKFGNTLSDPQELEPRILAELEAADATTPKPTRTAAQQEVIDGVAASRGVEFAEKFAHLIMCQAASVGMCEWPD